ncbi:MAG: hypothetical protein IPN19_00075 [Elusimicrobia bacterium]|nr:hypothetical protein [Elusimicrobiota bacterium]
MTKNDPVSTEPGLGKTRLNGWTRIFNTIVAIIAVGYGLYSFGYVVGKRAWRGVEVQRFKDPMTGILVESVKYDRLSKKDIDSLSNAKDTQENPLSLSAGILQQHFKNERDQQAVAEASGVKSVLCTNYVDWDFLGKPENLEAATKIYDVGFIVYSEEFAKKFHYPESHVYPLDKGMHVMEFRLKTEGVKQRCYLNMLMEKGLGLDVPDISYVMGGGFGKFGFPKQVGEFYVPPDELKYRKEMAYNPHGLGWETRYSQNFRLATLDYWTDGNGRGRGASHSGITLEEYSNSYYRDYDYFSIEIGPDILTTKILERGSSVWIKKKGGVDYSIHVRTNLDDFLKFKISPRLIEEVLPLMKETHHYSFMNNMKGVKKHGTH